MDAFNTVMIFLDILLVPISGTPKDDTELPDDKEARKKIKYMQRTAGVGKLSANNKNATGLEDPTLERDIWKLTKNYLKGDAALDFLANIPQILLLLVHSEDFDNAEAYERLAENQFFVIC